MYASINGHDGSKWAASKDYEVCNWIERYLNNGTELTVTVGAS